jgi:hypothetical protein
VNKVWRYGYPPKNGWYLVELFELNSKGQPYDVDYCRESAEEAGGREWSVLNPRSVKRWKKIEGGQS